MSERKLIQYGILIKKCYIKKCDISMSIKCSNKMSNVHHSQRQNVDLRCLLPSPPAQHHTANSMQKHKYIICIQFCYDSSLLHKPKPWHISYNHLYDIVHVILSNRQHHAHVTPIIIIIIIIIIINDNCKAP